jgi:hypothetical protein
MFVNVSAADFRSAFETSAASPMLRDILKRHRALEGVADGMAAVHEGPLLIDGDLKAPALFTLVTGEVDIGGALDLRSDPDLDEMFGLFIVAGGLRCRDYIGHYGMGGYIDGDLESGRSVLNGFGDSSLVVIGALLTRLFVGEDIWAKVGAGARMEYGEGYCLPIGYRSAAAEAIRPLHDEEDALRLVAVEGNAEGYALSAQAFAERIRAGLPIFR